MKTTLGALCVLTLFTTPALADGFTFGDSFDFLDAFEVERVYEKVDPMIVSVKPENQHTWACRDVYLEEHCGDLDGCTIKLMLQHTILPNDDIRGIHEYLFMENPATSLDKKGTVYGYTRQSAGGEHLWIAGGPTRYTVFAPWGWVHLLNYRSALCPDQGPGHGPAHDDPYRFTFLSHPHVHTVAIIED